MTSDLRDNLNIAPSVRSSHASSDSATLELGRPPADEGCSRFSGVITPDPAGDIFIRWVSPLLGFKPSREKGFGEEVAEFDELEMLVVAFDCSSRSGLAFRSANGGDDGLDTGASLSFTDDAASGEEGTPAPSFASLLFRICEETCQSLDYQYTAS